MSMRLPLATVLLLASVPLALPQDSSQDNDQRTAPMHGQIGYKSAQDADQRKTLLLKDFKPVSMLHAIACTKLTAPGITSCVYGPHRAPLLTRHHTGLALARQSPLTKVNVVALVIDDRVNLFPCRTMNAR